MRLNWIKITLHAFCACFIFSVNAQVTDFKIVSEGGDYMLEANNTLDQATISINGEEVGKGSGGNAIALSKEAMGRFAVLKVHDQGVNTHKLYHFSKKGIPKKIPFWLSIMPPLVAILLALITKEVISALFGGIWVGAWAINGLSFKGIFHAFLDAMERFVKGAIADPDHVSIILFSMLIGGMVSLISRNGGMNGIVNRLSKFAKSAQKTMLTTWALGLAIFFDDYANTLIVGNTMRPLTDKFRVSREKLAYIVDSTAAPISALAFVTTWIGFELSQIEAAIGILPDMANMSVYGLFIQSLKYSFYPVIAIFFMLMLILNKVDFGPMLKIERHARATGDTTGVDLDESAEEGDETEDLQPIEGKPHRAFNAVIPIALMVAVTLGGLIFTGLAGTIGKLTDLGLPLSSHSFSAVMSSIPSLPNVEHNANFFQKIGELIGNADSYKALIWGSSLGLGSAILLTMLGRILNLKQTMSAVIKGFKTMMSAIIILVLAWSLASTTKDLHTADFITDALGEGFSPYLFPAVTFILAGLISFSTGSSWSTMAILYPLVIPAVWIISGDAAMAESLRLELLYNCIATVLAGSVFGDHCSPISDTTILSSLASKCNHLSHVKTQAPYALAVGAIALLVGGGLVFFHLPWWLNYIIGIFLAYLVIRFMGKKVDDYVVE